jgi:uncharacterized membrane protein YfcA
LLSPSHSRLCHENTSIINATIGAIVLCYSSSGWFEVEAGATAPELVGAAVGVVAGSRHAQEINVRKFRRSLRS